MRKRRLQATVLQHPSAPTTAAEQPVPIEEFDAPNDLSMDDRRVWLELAPFAFANGRLTPAMGDAFKVGIRWVALERACAMSVTDRGSSTHDRAMKWAARFYDQFSLTPGGRPVATPKAAVVDDDEAFFGGGIGGR